MKTVVYFKEVDRGLVLNKTNRVILQHLFGRYADGMIGKQITLYATECQYKGELVPCLRIRTDRPQEQQLPETKAHKRKRQQVG